MLFAKLGHNLGTGGSFVADGAAPHPALEFVHDFGRKSVREKRKRLGEMDADHFPVTGGGVLARRSERALPIRSYGFGGGCEPRERFDVGESPTAQVRQFQRTPARDVAERVAAHIAVGRGIRHFADADAIEDNPDDSLKGHDGVAS